MNTEGSTPSERVADPSKWETDGRKVPRHEFKLRLFCAKCNGGWMSDAEAAAKRLIGPLLTVDSPRFEFSPEDSYKLAHWAVMKTAVILKASQLKHSLLPRVYYELRNGRIPDGIYVELASLGCHDIDWMVGPPIIWKALDLPREELVSVVERSIIGCIQLGKVVIRVSMVPTHEKIKRQQVAFKATVIHPYGQILSFMAAPIGSTQRQLPSFFDRLGCSTYSRPHKVACLS